MKYAYIGNSYNINEFKETFTSRANIYLKKWLEAIIFIEQPHLAEGLVTDNLDNETITLLKFCSFFSAVLRDETPEILDTKWDLEFENRHHGLISMYLNFIHNVYRK